MWVVLDRMESERPVCARGGQTTDNTTHSGHPQVVYKTPRGLAEDHYAVASSSWQQTEVLSFDTLQIATRMKGTTERS